MKGNRRRGTSRSALSPKLAKVAERAMAAHQRGDLKAAENDYRTVLARTPTHPDLALNLALLLAGSARPEQAMVVLEPAVRAHPDNSSLAATLANVQLECGQLQAATDTYRQVLARQPDNLNARFNLAGLLHRTGEHAESIEHLRAVAASAPNDETVWSALVRALLVSGDVPGARAALRRFESATTGTALTGINMLLEGQVCLAEGRVESATSALRTACSMAPTDAGLLQAAVTSLRDAGWSAQADTLLSEVTDVVGPLAGTARRLLAEGAMYGDDHDRAVALLERAIEDDPGWLGGRVRLATALTESGREERAREVLEALLAAFPTDVDAIADAGLVFRLLGDGRRARTLFEAALRIAPDDPDLRNALGLCLVDDGDMAGAEREFDSVLAGNPSNGNAWYNRSRTRRYVESDDPFVAALGAHAQSLATLASGEEPPPLSASMVGFACGKVFNDLGQTDLAFSHYERANRLQRDAGGRYDVERHRSHVHNLCRVFGPELFEHPVEGASDSAVPILIVGMPRSGTTLVEQILASHPAVHGAGELRDLASLSRETARLAGVDYPQSVPVLSGAQNAALADRYLQRLQSLGGASQRVTDKLPTNFQHLGLACRLFTRLKVIHCRRDPMDTCFANYIQYFAEGHRYSYDLGDIAHFYARYRELMAHWEAVLPVEILHVDYESVVDDVEREARRIVEYVNLPWDDNCVRFHESDRKVETASNWQVRQPIYRHASRRWRRYADHLSGLRADLERLVPGLVID